MRGPPGRGQEGSHIGFWSRFGKGALAVGGVAAAPYTGGASLAVTSKAIQSLANERNKQSILNTAGQIAGAAAPTAEALAAGRAAGRMDEATMNQRQDTLAEARYRDQIAATQGQNVYNQNTANFGLNKAETDLAQRNYTLAAPGKRASNSVRGDILANAHDVAISGLPKGVNVPTITGGLRPSMFSDNTRALGGLMSTQALEQQRAGDQFAPLPDMPGYTAPPSAPGLTPLPQASTLDKILTTTGTIGSLASTIPDYAAILAKYKRKPTPMDESGANPDNWETYGRG
jgi:hypothetical protein